MDLRQLIKAVLIIAGIVTAALIIAVGVLSLFPEQFGILPGGKTVVADSVDTPGLIYITPAKLDMLERIAAGQREVESENDSLSVVVADMKKRLGDFKIKYDQIKDSLKQYDNTRSTLNDEIASLKDSLRKTEFENRKLKNSVSRLQKSLEQSEEFIAMKQDSLEKDNFESFAKIYNNSGAGEVARILSEIDERDAAKILKLMNKRKAGKVLESMEPDRAAAILLLGSLN